MPSLNLLRKRAKLEIPRNGFQRKDREGFTKNKSIPRRFKELKRSVLRKRQRSVLRKRQRSVLRKRQRSVLRKRQRSVLRKRHKR